MYCAKCGKPLMDTDRFCQYCGTPTEVGENENKIPGMSGMSVGEKQIDTDSMKDKETPAAGNGNTAGKTAVKITIGFFAMVLAGLGIFVIKSPKESGGNDYTGNESVKPEGSEEGTVRTEESEEERAARTEEPLIAKPLLKEARGYDEYGNLRREITYDRDGSKVECEYDQDGNLITETSFDEKGHQTIRITYDGTGNIISEFELVYGDDGNRIKERYFSSNSQSESVSEFEYDYDDKLIKMQDYNDYILNEIYEYEYDDSGVLTEINRYNPGNGENYHNYNTGSLKLEYDSKGKLIQYREREYSSDEKIVDFKSAASSASNVDYEIAHGTINGIRERESDSKGRTVAIRDYTDGEVVYSQEYEHDSEGHCIKYSTFVYETLEAAKKYDHGYEYEYDSNNNLSVERYYNGEGNLEYEITRDCKINCVLS